MTDTVPPRARRPIARFRKLPARYAGIVMPLVLSGLMTLIVSGIATALNVGVVPDLPARWSQAWGASWLVAFPTLLAVLPVVRRIVGAVVESPPGSA